MNKQLAVVIGRFAPTHNEHVQHLLSRALDNYDHVLVLLGSSLKTRDPKNPFTWQQREMLLEEALAYHYQEAWWRNRLMDRIHCAPLKDYLYSDTRWNLQVQKLVAETTEYLGGDWDVTLVGNDKDESSYYLKLFPQWDSDLSERKAAHGALGATEIRKAIYEEDWEAVANNVAPAVLETLKHWHTSEPGQWITEEYHWHEQYQMVLARKRDQEPENIGELINQLTGVHIGALEWDEVSGYIEQQFSPFKEMPYKPVYHTCDNVVLWRGHVLLVERRARPGKGLWALPGGFLNPDEWIQDGALREGEEESRVRIWPPGGLNAYLHNGRQNPPPRPVKLSKAWQTARRTFDCPGRSMRGRIITDAFLWKIPDEFEVDTRAGDDAAKAKFFSLHEILNGPMDYLLFEDHQSIIAHMVL